MIFWINCYSYDSSLYCGALRTVSNQDYVPDSEPIGYVLTTTCSLLFSNWLLLLRGNVAVFNTTPRCVGHEVKLLFNYQIESPVNLSIVYSCFVCISITYPNDLSDSYDSRCLPMYLSEPLVCIFHEVESVAMSQQTFISPLPRRNMNRSCFASGGWSIPLQLTQKTPTHNLAT